MRKPVPKTFIFLQNISAIVVFLAIIFLLPTFSVFAQNRAIVRIAAETTIETDSIKLGDIAKISGSEATVNRLKTVSLGYAPNVGMIREVFKDKILLSIAAAGFAKSDFMLDAPAKIIVRRGANFVNQDLLREAVEKALLADFEKNNVTAKIVSLEFPSNIQIPTGKVEIRVSTAPIANLFAPFFVSLEIRVDEKIVRHISATVRIEAETEVLVALHDLVSGSKITEADVKKETRKLEKPVTNYVREVEKLRGTILVKNISAGAEITKDSLAAGYVIRLGDIIRIVGESGKMQITISGEARASGRIGDRIAVKNSQSGAILQAVVVDEGLVKIIF